MIKKHGVKRFNWQLLLIIVVTAFSARTLPACTSFILQDDSHQILANNYDWHLADGLIIVNKRGVTKRALLLNPMDTPAVWTSKYGSVTFNQYGREIACCGMNEAGLALAPMWLNETRYPQKDQRQAVMIWSQYQIPTR